MSRPPYPHRADSTGRDEAGGELRRLDYLPLQFADLVALQEQLAVTRLGRPLRGESDPDEFDFARTFMELSALVGHVLSSYQRHYAREAYLSTAQAPGSLVRHAHRLAYDPDPGLAATGYAVLFTKEGVGGTVAAGLPLASVPLGKIKAQDYETREDLVVDATLNELIPVGATLPGYVTAGLDELRLEGVGHGLEAGDIVVLAPHRWRGFTVKEVTEHPDENATTVRVSSMIGMDKDIASADPPLVLLADPSLTLRPFGADADPVLFPPAEVRAASDDNSADYWYEVSRADGGGYDNNDVYLSEQLSESLVGHLVMCWTGGVYDVLHVDAQADGGVSLHREVTESFATQTVAVTKTGDNFTTSLTPTTATQVVRSRISGTATAIQVSDSDGHFTLRPDLPFPAQWLTGWRVEIPLAKTKPNPAGLVQPLVLPGLLPALAPGRPLVFTDRNETRAQIVLINRAELDSPEVPGATRIWWDPVTPGPAIGWVLGDLKVFGNVARVSHGRTAEETLGGSDGVTPFQRFALGESPLTLLPSVAGGEPELEVRVNDVLWQRVLDFVDSGPDDRHYRSVTDADRVTSVVFGDGRNGAVPPSGRKNIAAVYRVGLGRVGDVEARRLSRLKRAHPLLDRVVNVTPVSGGAEPAEPAAIRAQATRWIRTFDRAVSISDLADLALTMPGIARAASRWDQSRGAVLVVATAAGETPADLAAVRAFLDARRDVTFPLEVRGPQARAVRLTVDVEPDPAYLVETVKTSVRAALHGEDAAAPGMFTFPARELGQPAFLSEVYARLEAVTGVIGVRVVAFETDGLPKGTPPAAPVITSGVEEWLRLAPNDLTLTTSAAASAA